MIRMIPAIKLLAGFFVVAVLATATAASANLIPTEDLFKPSEFSNVRMSPDGMFIAAIARTPAQPGGQNLIVMNLDDRSVKVLTGYPEDEVTQFWWVSDKRLVFMLHRDFESRTKSADYLGTYAINRDGLVAGKFTSRLKVTDAVAEASAVTARGVAVSASGKISGSSISGGQTLTISWSRKSTSAFVFPMYTKSM